MAQNPIRLQNIFYESQVTGGVPGLNTITYSLFYDTSTGNYEAKQTSLIGFAIIPATLLVNGSFTSDAIKDASLFTDNDVNQPTQKAKDLLIRAKNDVYAAYGHLGGANKGNKINSSALPANKNTFLVNNAAAGTNPGIASALGGPLALPPGQGNPLFGALGINLEEYGTSFSKMKDLFPNELKYPLDIIDSQQDILKITQFTYSAPYGDVFKGIQNDEIFKGGANSPGVQRQSALKEKIQSLTLPIPNNVADSNGVNWGSGDEMSAMNMAAVAKVGTIARALTGTGLLGELVKLADKDLGTYLQSEKAFKAAGMLAVGGLDNPSTTAAIQSLILKKGGFDISPETILSRGYGVVANSNLELLFSGPILRGFQFSYVFSPRSVEEAKMCRNIIRYFKQGMAAKKKNSTGYGAASFFLGTPNVFKLEYLTTDPSNGKRVSIEGLNKFKICALSGMNVSYADGQWSAFEKGQPVRMQLSLNFKELEPVYESDYQETQSSGFKLNSVEGKDQEPVFPDDVGF